MTDFVARACVVTGATSGIGQSLALALARHGALVWAIGRSSERLDALDAAANGARGDVLPLQVDLEDDEALEQATTAILARTPDLDVLAHSAGAIALGSFETISPSEFDLLYRVNLRAPFVLTQDLLPSLRRTRGQIVFVNSSAGLRAGADNALYAATKHGLKALADGLRDQVNEAGVRVLSVYPGRTATPMQRFVHEYEGHPYRTESLLRPEDVVDVVLAALSQPASGEVTDVSVRPMRKLNSS